MIDDQPLTAVTQQRYLGIIFDCCLQWNAQVSEVCRKCSYYLQYISLDAVTKIYLFPFLSC